MRYKPNYNSFGKPIHGFTLIELLVVISIIALLMGILLPSLRSARELAIGIVCQSQMRQIGTAVTAYTTENRDSYPQCIGNNPEPGRWPGDSSAIDGMSEEEARSFVARYATWWGLLAPYTGLEDRDMESMERLREASVGTVGNCPAHGRGATDETIGGRESFSYAGNRNFFRGWRERDGLTVRQVSPLKAFAVRHPSSKILVWELFHSADWPLAFAPVTRRGSPHKELLGRVGTQHGWNGDGLLEDAGWGPTHRQSLNYLFSDGSVDSVSHMEKMLGDGYEKP